MSVFEPKMDTFSHFLGSGGTPGGHLSKRYAKPILEVVLVVFAPKNLLFFRRSFFHTFCDFCVPRASKIGVFWSNFYDFCVPKRISENDALAWVSARSGRFQTLPKSYIFDVFSGIEFKWSFGTLFFRFFMIFSDFGRPFGHHFGVLLPTPKNMQNGCQTGGGRS